MDVRPIVRTGSISVGCGGGGLHITEQEGKKSGDYQREMMWRWEEISAVASNFEVIDVEGVTRDDRGCWR